MQYPHNDVNAYASDGVKISFFDLFKRKISNGSDLSDHFAVIIIIIKCT